jgi:hypothetical protein
MGGPPAWGLDVGLTTFHCKNIFVTNNLYEPRTWTDSLDVVISSPKCRSKLGHKDSKQIVWKCVTVQIFGNDSIKSNLIQEEIQRILSSGNTCYHFIQNLLSSRLLSKNVIKIRIYKTIILLVVIYGCETWSLSLREEHRLRVFQNRVLRRIFGPKRNEVTGEWWKLHNEELRDLYSSPSIIRIMK